MQRPFSAAQNQNGEEMKEAEKLVLKLKPYKGKRRYPESLRLKTGRYIVRCRKQGESWGVIQQKLCLGNNTIKSWAEKVESNDIQPVKIKRVGARTKTINSLTIMSPQGWRIEGLDFQTATQFLKEIHR